MPHLTSTAGRHAADLARRRQAEQVAAFIRNNTRRVDALRQLAGALRRLGLSVLSTHDGNLSTRVLKPPVELPF